MSIPGGNLVCLLMAGTAIAAAGCAGYQVGARSLYRPDIRTVYVPMIESDSLRRTLGERLTEAVVKEIELKTPYKVVSTPNADSVLTVRIVSERKQALAETVNSELRHIEVDFLVQVSWIDRRGLMMQQAGIPSPLALRVGQTASFVPEAGQSIATAHQKAIQELAEQIVSQMEMQW